MKTLQARAIAFSLAITLTMITITGCQPRDTGTLTSAEMINSPALNTTTGTPTRKVNNGSYVGAVKTTANPTNSTAKAPDSVDNNANDVSGNDASQNQTEEKPDNSIPSGDAGNANKPQYPQTATKSLVPEIYHASPGTVALTIDDGPTPYTAAIIKTFASYHSHVTFFFVGKNAERYPDAVRLAVKNGDAIGIHSMTHPEMTKLSKAEQAQQIREAATVIHKNDPNPLTMYRPPYELWNNFTEEIMQKDHLALALWDADPRDWSAKSVQDIVNSILNANPSGKVFDMHDTQMTLDALPAILAGLQKQHLKVVVMSAPKSVTGIPGPQSASAPTNKTSVATNSTTNTSATNTTGSGAGAATGNTTNSTTTNSTGNVTNNSTTNLTGSTTNSATTDSTGNVTGNSTTNLTGNTTNSATTDSTGNGVGESTNSSATNPTTTGVVGTTNNP